MAQDRWLTVEQVAERLQVSPVTVRRWLREGLLAGSRLPGKAGWRISEQDVERFLAERAGQRSAEQHG
ncbi:hypothetical protein HRbin28_02308 [bacterium HR28]|nr:hypothetical protein HRbin28_02308 [bacterium HR28]